MDQIHRIGTEHRISTEDLNINSQSQPLLLFQPRTEQKRQAQQEMEEFRNIEQEVMNTKKASDGSSSSGCKINCFEIQNDGSISALTPAAAIAW